LLLCFNDIAHEIVAYRPQHARKAWAIVRMGDAFVRARSIHTRSGERRSKLEGEVTMKLLLGTTMIAGLIAGAAQAADMPLKAPPRAAPYYSDWTGFYVFGFGGYSWGRISPDDFGIEEVFGTGFHNPKPKGGVFGFGGGYNWQYGTWVGGVEVDYGFSDEKETQSVPLIDEEATSASLHSKIDALGSARLRVGYLFTPNLLAYGTAGLGWGRSKLSLSKCFGDDGCDTFTAKSNLFGWVAGGGLEWKLPGFDHVRIRGEYLHFDFGSTGYSFQSDGGTFNFKTTDDVARGALIWSFN
jgi:outer membrane immunogenic protein